MTVEGSQHGGGSGREARVIMVKSPDDGALNGALCLGGPECMVAVITITVSVVVTEVT